MQGKYCFWTGFSYRGAFRFEGRNVCRQPNPSVSNCSCDSPINFTLLHWKPNVNDGFPLTEPKPPRDKRTSVIRAFVPFLKQRYDAASSRGRQGTVVHDAPIYGQSCCCIHAHTHKATGRKSPHWLRQVFRSLLSPSSRIRINMSSGGKTKLPKCQGCNPTKTFSVWG